MAGETLIFNDAVPKTGDGTHDMNSHVFKMAIITNAKPALITDPNPVLADYTQVSAAGTYVTGGNTMAGPTYNNVAGLTTWDLGDPAPWLADPANSANAYQGVIYNSTAPSDECIAFVDLNDGAPFDMSANDLTIEVNIAGVYEILNPQT